MAVELIPSVLATTPSQLTKRAVLAERLGQTIHLDVMDGKFVSKKTVSLSALSRRTWRRRVEIHAMVDDPVAIISLLDDLHPKRVYLHIELGSAVLPIIAVLRSRRIEFGLAISPRTDLNILKIYIRYATSVLVMSVQPGRYQAPFWPGAIDRIRRIRRRWPKVKVAVDGGMNERTIPRAIRAGAHRIVVGSDVMLHPTPDIEWRKLKSLTK